MTIHYLCMCTKMVRNIYCIFRFLYLSIILMISGVINEDIIVGITGPVMGVKISSIKTAIIIEINKLLFIFIIIFLII